MASGRKATDYTNDKTQSLSKFCLSIINNKLQAIDYQGGAAGGNRTLVE
jgi:hypothetical protein